MMIDPISESKGSETARPEGGPNTQMDLRPLDNVTTAAQKMASSFDRSIVRSERIGRLNTYWQAKAKGGVPSRAEIDPVDVRELLPNLMMIDAIGDPVRFRYRLVGTRVVQYTGFDFTGRCLDEMVFQGRDFIEQCYRRMLEEKRPIFGHYAWLVRSRHFGQCEFALFPLSDDGVTVNRSISIEDYERMERDILTFGQQAAPARKLVQSGE
ncbi:PAS domain-containing protein [Dongia deserti]|uniref:PAS domain-containing protein n=1 Tax=Dongia deserti TaxID=2268030 RepID=UPI000E64C65F|nr:PAS domain-containing protein [Dongia deserti]